MRRVRLGTILTTLVLVTSVPLAVLAGWLTWTSGRQQRTLIHGQNIDKARAVSAAIDLEVERTMGALVALSTLDAIDQSDLHHFTQIAGRLLPIHSSWQAVRLIDRQLRIAASTHTQTFTAADGPIEVKTSIDTTHAVVTVTDNGEGIAPDFLPYVFDRFRQESENVTRQHSGLGIGLALAKTLTELQGGTIEAHSAGKGLGSTFVVRFPLRRDVA